MKNLLSLIILIAIASCASNSGHTADIVIHMDDYSNDSPQNFM